MRADSGETRPSPDDALEALRRLPKAELHLHLDGSLRAETLLDLLPQAEKSQLPPTGIEETRRYMIAPASGTLVDYLGRFRITLAAMQSAEALERISYELAEDLAAEACRYVEIRYSPVLHTEQGLEPWQAVDATLAGLHKAERDFGIQANLILCALRNLSPSVSEEVAELAVGYSERGVVAFDLAGPEAGHPPSVHRAAFAVARAANLAVTIHAGEAEGADSIREAIHSCGARRIGHGTRLDEDVDLLEYVRDFRIPLEMCLISNVQTGAVHDLRAHPMRKYFNSGVVLSLNTDNRLISGTTLTGEYHRAYRELGFTLSDLGRVAEMSFESAFLPWPEKRALVEAVGQKIEGWREALSP
jgi:adenosine deaminase